MFRKLLLSCGIASSLVYLAANIAGAMMWKDYRSASQTVSELSAIAAPSRSVVYPLGLAYDALLMAFAAGVWQCARDQRRLRVTAILLGAIGALGLFWPPMHLRGTPATLTDTMHIVFASIVAPLTVVAIGFGATAFGKRFRLYSIATIVVLLAFGAWAGLQGPRIASNLPTPWLGVAERINIFGYLAWVVALAIGLWR